MEKNLEQQVSAVVENLFNEKEQTKIREKTEAELQRAASSISELTTALEDKNTETAELETKVSDSEAQIQELTSKLEAAEKELETANTKLGESEKAVEDMRKDRAAEERMADLEDAGVTRSDTDSQLAKVREMTEEDFASYKDELVSIRQAVVAELEKARETAEADAKAEEEAADKAAEEAKKIEKKTDEEDPEKKKKDKKKEKSVEEEGSEESEESEEASGEQASEEEEEKETTTPAQVTPGMQAMASLNMEFRPSEDVLTKYRKLGEAMAKRFNKSEE